MKDYEHHIDIANQRAAIDLGDCLDLTESTSLGLVEASYRELDRMSEISEIPLSENKSGHKVDEDLVRRYLDCAAPPTATSEARDELARHNPAQSAL